MRKILLSVLCLLSFLSLQATAGEKVAYQNLIVDIGGSTSEGGKGRTTSKLTSPCSSSPTSQLPRHACLKDILV
ncbi:MAG: hypothetical protein HQ457_04490 [Betaproteobacteria bacterium]|nr:hypothetical protein [Betaproteobacteria bacterium]